VSFAQTAPVTTFTLENGMDVVVIEDHRAPVVQHMVWYRAGSADEPLGASGVAHFLEHLLFKATDTMEAGEFSRVVAANGGRDNAFTSYDYTAYHQRVAADRLELMMTMEADRMRNLRLSVDDIATERDVILEERNQRTDSNPRALFHEQMNAAQYLNHRYGVPVIGWRHEMETLDLDDALDFYAIHYSPNNAIAVISGDVDPDEVRELAQRHYGAIAANPDLPDRFRSQEPPHRSARRLTYKDPRVAQPYVQISYIAQERDPGNQTEAAALTLLARVLAGGPTSVLVNKLQFETKEALYVGSFYSGTTVDSGNFGLVIIPPDGQTLAEGEAALRREVAEFLTTGVDPEQLDRIKMQYRASEVYALDNVDGIANRYGRALAIGLSVQDVEQWPEIVQAVTAQDILDAAHRVLQPERSVTGWLARPDPTQNPEEVNQ
jgi:zinc protease